MPRYRHGLLAGFISLGRAMGGANDSEKKRADRIEGLTGIGSSAVEAFLGELFFGGGTVNTPKRFLKMAFPDLDEKQAEQELTSVIDKARKIADILASFSNGFINAFGGISFDGIFEGKVKFEEAKQSANDFGKSIASIADDTISFFKALKETFGLLHDEFVMFDYLSKGGIGSEYSFKEFKDAGKDFFGKQAGYAKAVVLNSYYDALPTKEEDVAKMQEDLNKSFSSGGHGIEDESLGMSIQRK